MAEVTLEQASKKARDLFNKGFTALERGNFDYAINLLTASLQQEPKLASARRYLRIAQIQKAKQAKASSFSQVFSKIRNLPRYGSATAMLRAGKAEQALGMAEDLLKDEPLNLGYVKLFVKAATALEMPEAASQTLEIAREYYPDDVDLLAELGDLYRALGKTKEARDTYERVSTLRPNDPDILKKLKDAMAVEGMASGGWAQMANKGGTFRDVMKDTKEAVMLEQENKAVKSDADLDALIAESLRKIAAEPKNVNFYRALARLYVQQKNFDESIAVLRKALEVNPGDPELDQSVSVVRLQRYDHEIEQLSAAGQAEAAQAKLAERQQFLYQDVEERVRRYPNDLKLRYEYGVILLEFEKINEAIQQLQMSQRNPKYRIRSLYYMAICFKIKEQYDLAAEQLESARSELLVMDDVKKDVCYELGTVAELLGDRARAIECYKQIYQVDIGYRDVSQKIELLYQRKA